MSGWDVRELRAGNRGTVLMLPGALASDVFYEDVAAAPALAGWRGGATPLPGYAGTPPPDDDSIEAYARGAGELAAELGASVVVGHSLGANVALEMAAASGFTGALVLISPSFSRRDESIVPRVLDRLAGVLGHLPYALVLRLIGGMLKGAVPANRVSALAAELRRNDARFVRRNTRTYLRYQDRHGDLAHRLCDAAVPAWVVFGEHDDIKLQAAERRRLEACPHVTLVTIPGTGHFSLNTHPTQIGDLIGAAEYAAMDA
jgi:pimeloyl-ACP methyl ester carboxylesterase